MCDRPTDRQTGLDSQDRANISSCDKKDGAIDSTVVHVHVSIITDSTDRIGLDLSS